MYPNHRTPYREKGGIKFFDHYKFNWLLDITTTFAQIQ